MKRKLFLCIVIVLSLVLCATFAACAGPSAYDLAVQQGFVGTLDEWLTSLKAEPDENSYIDSIVRQYTSAVESGYTGTLEDFIELTSGVTDPCLFAANLALRSAVTVRCGFSGRFGATTTQAGSGVIFADDDNYAYIVTNYHVIYGDASTGVSTQISIYLYGSEYTESAFTATLIGGSSTFDIAVLRITKNDLYRKSAARVCDVVDSDTVTPCMTAIAVGNPEGEGISTTSGVVSVVSEYITLDAIVGNGTIEPRVIRIDTAVNSGNSGGGLFNSRGQLIGIVNAKTVASGVENISYAIPSNIAIGIARRILRGGTDKCVIGITMVVKDSYSSYNETTGQTEIVQLIGLESVTAGSSADGLLKAGDILVSATYAGKTWTIDKLYSMGDRIFDMDVGGVLTFEIIRNGATMVVEVTLKDAVPL